MHQKELRRRVVEDCRFDDGASRGTASPHRQTPLSADAAHLWGRAQALSAEAISAVSSDPR
jgi:hypothetical protein